MSKSISRRKIFAKRSGSSGSGTTHTVAGSDTQVQYNDAGSFGADANFTWDKTAKDFKVGVDNSGIAASSLVSISNTTGSAYLGLGGGTFGIGLNNPNFIAGINVSATVSSISLVTNNLATLVFSDASGLVCSREVQALSIGLGAIGVGSGFVNLTGTTSGTISIKPQAAAGTYNFNLPITVGTVGQFLTSQAGGGTAMIWTSPNIQALRVVTAAGAVTVATTDTVVVVNKTVGAATVINLPATPATGLTFTIKDGKGDAAANNITITPAAGNIDGGATKVMGTNYQTVKLVYNGTEWNII